MATVEAKTEDTLRITLEDGATLTVSASDVIDAIKRQGTLCRLVADMRHAQKEYFRTKSTTALDKAKTLEGRVDQACEEVLGRQARLFG